MSVQCEHCGQELDDGQHDKERCARIRMANRLDEFGEVELADIQKDMKDIKKLLVILIKVSNGPKRMSMICSNSKFIEECAK